MIWEVIKLVFEFLPKLPTIERGMAAIKDDKEAVYIIDHVVPVVQRSLGNPDVTALLKVFRDLFNSLAEEGGSKSAVADVLVKHGADRSAVMAAAGMAAGNPDSYNGGSDNVSI
jgi:hypothetical protein